MQVFLVGGVVSWAVAGILFVLQVAKPDLSEKWNRRIIALQGILSLLGGILIAIYLANKDLH